MKLDKDQFLEAGIIFEKTNGHSQSDFEKDIIAESKLNKYESYELERLIVDGLNSHLYKNDDERVSAYWALSKTNNRNLITNFKNWLRIEFENGNENMLFQLLVALDRFDEPVFHKSRTSRGEDETDLNLRDAKAYLNKNNNSAQQRV